LDSTTNNVHYARLLASHEKESGAWLNAFPCTSIGTHLDNSTFRISVALRLGLKVCEPHTCSCGFSVDKYGHHGLHCKNSAGRRYRHELVNDIIKRAFISADIPALREPIGCNRSDGKRPDGLTLIPWRNGKCLLWDFTCVDSVAPSYINKTSKESGLAAKLAENRKFIKYESLESSYIFVPVAIETFGPWGVHARKLIKDLSHKINETTSEKRSFGYLSQRISIAIQRGNAAAVLGTLPSGEPLDFQ